MACLFQPGDGLGGYRIARLLGAGGFAEVYEAVDRAGVRRALKVLSAQAPQGTRLRAGLAREAAALTRIEHLNVVRLYEAGIEDDHLYLVLEMVEGVTLADKIADPLTLAPLEDLVRWIHQASEGVAEAHREGVIHRDLKPANILVTSADVVKVIDFGIAQLRTWSSGPHQENLLGTALYMAPEQLHAQPSDARADVYSMGVILYEALAGAHPLGIHGATPTVFQVFQQHLLGEPRPLRELAPDVPPELAALVHQALAKDPERRTPTMRALADGLKAIHDQMRRQRRAAVRQIASIGYDVEANGPLSGPEVSSSRPPAPRSVRPLLSFYPEPPSIRPPDEPSPLATTDAHDPGRSALAPPPPAVTPAPPPPSPAPPAPPPPAPAEPEPTSSPQTSSAVPVVSEGADPSPAWSTPARRRALQGLAVVLLALTAALVWRTRRPPIFTGDTPAASSSPGAVAAPAIDGGPPTPR